MSEGERASRFAGPLRAFRARPPADADKPRDPASKPSDPADPTEGPSGSLGEDQRWVTAIVQEALIRAWRNRDDLHEARGSVRGWLLTVIRNIIIDRSRARAARPQEVPENPTRPPLIDDHADQLVTTVVLLEALDQLSEEHRAVLVELYFNDRSVTEAAEKLGIPAGTVKSRSYYALRQLRGQLNPADLQ